MLGNLRVKMVLNVPQKRSPSQAYLIDPTQLSCNLTNSVINLNSNLFSSNGSLFCFSFFKENIKMNY